MLSAFPMGRAWARSVVLCAISITACGSESNTPIGGAGQNAPLPGGSSGSPASGNSGSMAPPNSGPSGAGGSSVATAGGGAAGSAGGTSIGAAGASGAAATAGAGGSTAPQPGGSADWTLMAFDHGSTYFNKNETVLTKANAATLDVLWQKDLGGPVYSAPLQIGDKIYVAAPSTVRAFNAMTGDELWSTMVGSTSSLSYADGKLYLNSRAANIVAINAADGMQLWSKPINTASMADGSSSVLPVGNILVVGGSNGGIELLGGTFRGFMSALDLATGAVKWTTYTVPDGAKGASIWSSPAADLAAGIVYGSTGNNYGPPATDTSDAFIAFDMMTGDIKWKNQRMANDTFGGGIGAGSGPDADFGANPVLYETLIGGVMTKVIGAGNKGGVAHAVRADNGMELWKRELCPGSADGSKGVFVNSAWSGKYLIMACNATTTATLYGLDGATGEVGWMRMLTGPVWGRISVANGVGFSPSGKSLEVFDVDTGATIKNIPSKGGSLAGTITISNGRVAFGEGMNWSSAARGQWLTVLTVK